VAFNVGAVVLFGGGLAAIGGSIMIIRRRRKLLRDADAPKSAPSPKVPPFAPPPTAL
jgi:hypothetical protein